MRRQSSSRCQASTAQRAATGLSGSPITKSRRMAGAPGVIASKAGGGRLSGGQQPRCLRFSPPQQVEQFVDAPEVLGLTDRESVAVQGKRVGDARGAPAVDWLPGLWHRADTRHG